MPFTFSHPAAILPAKFFPERWISLTALVIGSITPDFEYFIRMKNYGIYGHTWGGIFWFDLPLGFLLTFVYHRFVRDGLIDNLPRFLRNRLYKFKGLDWTAYVRKHFLQVIICLLIGIATHVVWDGFTHRAGYFVQMIPWLDMNSEVFGVNHARFYILQNISSLLGMGLVVIAVLRIPKGADAGKRKIIKYWLVACAIAALITVIRTVGWFHHNDLEEIFVVHIFSGIPDVSIPEDVIMTAISASIIGLIVTPLIVRTKEIKATLPS
ncbi:MAG TPA: DUF4184 family protein [Bacteroidia bacterium]|jgi:hypothetical protein|nr:DUF4184 family protein [Bacteroidia bacterium]